MQMNRYGEKGSYQGVERSRGKENETKRKRGDMNEENRKGVRGGDSKDRMSRHNNPRNKSKEHFKL